MSWYEEQETINISKFLFLSTELDNVEHRFVGPEMIDIALAACQEFLSVLEHGDIDLTVETPPAVQEEQWAEFLQDYYMVVQWVCFPWASRVCQNAFRIRIRIALRSDLIYLQHWQSTSVYQIHIGH